jgi:chorismate mutase-like protein
MPKAPAPDDRLAALRKEIDAADEELVRTLARRFTLVEEIADIKAARGDPVVVPARIEAVLARVEGHAQAAGLDPATARRLWRAIIDEACALEEARITPGGAQRPSGATPTRQR